MQNSKLKFAEVAIALPIDRIFHYSIPENYSSDIAIGKRVFVPFRNRTIVGYVVGFSDKSDVKEVKEIKEIIDKEPIINDEMLKLTRWIKDNYFCSWGAAIEAAIPGGIKKGKASIGSKIKEPYIKPEEYPPSSP